MDWMMEVCSDLRLQRQTFHLSVTLLDSFLSKVQNIPKNKFQLVGLAALMITSKLEEVFPWEIKHFKAAANDGFSKEEIIEMEWNMS